MGYISEKAAVFTVGEFEGLETDSRVDYIANYFAILVCKNGNVQACKQFDVTVPQNSSAVFIIPNNLHQVACTEIVGAKIVFFKERFFCDDLPKTTAFHQSVFFSSSAVTLISLEGRYSQVLKLVELINTEIAQQAHISDVVVRNHLYSILLMASNAAGSEYGFASYDVAVRLVINFKNLFFKFVGRHYTVKQFAQMLNVSIVTLEQAFKKYEQTTPKKWLVANTVSSIKKDLRNTTLSISELAYKYGFTDTSNFIKYFKKHTGATPRSYRAVRYFDTSILRQAQ